MRDKNIRFGSVFLLGALTEAGMIPGFDSAALVLATASANAVDYAPLNCAAASTASEKTIYCNYGLGQ